MYFLEGLLARVRQHLRGAPSGGSDRAPVLPTIDRVLSSKWVREHAAVSSAFLVSRAVLHFAGLRFNFILGWMFLSDPRELEERLFETLYFFHAYPPGSNLVTGVLLKIGGSHASSLAHAAMQLMGLVLVNSLFYLGRVSGLSFGAAAALCVAFSLIPQSIYFEHLYLYACPIAALLCLSAAFFHRAVARQTQATWFAFFLTCAAIGWIRNTFHLVWFAAMVGFALVVTKGPQRRGMLLGAIGPALFLLSLYVKNLAVFGVFEATTFGAANLSTMTVARLPDDVRRTWVNEGKLSKYAPVSVYSGPRDYLQFFESSENPRWPASMNALDRPSVNSGNYNHWFFLEINRARRSDALYYMKERPFDYTATVIDNVARLFEPSTEWHPQDKTPASPHHQHRSILGVYERVYNTAVHSWPVAPMGLYLFFPLAFVWAILRARSLACERTPDATAEGALLYYCLFQVAFVLAASCWFTFGETARYRYDVEPLIWLLGVLSVAGLWPRDPERKPRELLSASP